MKDNLPVILFETEQSWINWLEENTSAAGVWMRIAKKKSGVTSISYQQALDIAICYGWIDGQKNKYDEKTFLQRFTPRKTTSNWSKVNKEKAQQFISEGKMKPAGLATIENAKKTGAWDKAYDSQSNAKVPADFKKALNENPKALAFFKALDKINRFSIIYRIQTARTDEKRSEKIKLLIEMLERNEKFHN